MKESIHFHIEKLGHRDNPTDCPVDTKVYEKIRSIVRDSAIGIRGEPPDESSFSMTIRCSPTDPALLSVVTILRDEGWEPWPFRDWRPEEMFKTRKYWMRYCRDYTSKELACFSLLSVLGWGRSDITSWASKERENGSLIGKVQSVRGRWNKPSGLLYCESSFVKLVSDDVKRGISDAGIRGVEFLPLLWDQPTKAKSKFWEITSLVRLPKSLTTRTHDVGNSWFFDDGIDCPEIRYSSDGLDPLGEFDVGLTSDYLGTMRGNTFNPLSYFVVSQRFRTVLARLDAYANYAPVRIGEPPVQLPSLYGPAVHERVAAIA